MELEPNRFPTWCRTLKDKTWCLGFDGFIWEISIIIPSCGFLCNIFVYSEISCIWPTHWLPFLRVFCSVSCLIHKNMSVSHQGKIIQPFQTVNLLQEFAVIVDTSGYFCLLEKFSVLLPHGSGKPVSCDQMSAALTTPDLMSCYRS